MRPIVTLLLFALPAFAAPVPKALKAKPTMDGVWEWVEFNGDNGTMEYVIPKPTYRRIEGDRISTGKRSIDDLFREPLILSLQVRDEQQPHLRTYDTGGVKYSSVVELDGDTLRWCYALDLKATITECKPAKGVYYYEFKRVKEEK
jgi:hypothetical protein